MSWHWEAAGDTSPAAVPPSSSASAHASALGLEQRFPTQGDAESWLGEVYPDLVAAGVSAVSLYEEGRQAYGPMRLEP